MQEENNIKQKRITERLALSVRALTGVIAVLLGVIVFLSYLVVYGWPETEKIIVQQNNTVSATNTVPALPPGTWIAPDTAGWPAGDSGELLRYGRDLIANTSYYLGPHGKVSASSNGMNCQNCHLDAGTRPFGNNYGAVSATYPKFRGRSGTMESIPKRVGDCFERSLNGKSPDSASREMQAIVAYINWLGSNVKKTEEPVGSGIVDLPFLARAADTVKGKLVYDTHCSSCHQPGGNGVMNVAGTGYTYPPLWGEHSYNIGAGLFRLSRFAGYVKYNMPQGVTYGTPKLTDEEAWDVAAYVNSRQRPFKDLSGDWPDISAKPADHPFGPYADTFSEQQHKFGPFDVIADAKKKGGKK